MNKSKPPTAKQIHDAAQILGRAFGAIGGRSRSPAKIAAGRVRMAKINADKAARKVSAQTIGVKEPGSLDMQWKHE